MRLAPTTLALLAAGCLALSAAALAQTPAPTTPPAAPASPAAANPVMAHFRAYRAALDRGDMRAAEVEAAAAYEASVARDGDGGSTGVLAVNLAQARLSLRRVDDAYQPALRAFTIAANGGRNLDPLLTRLVLGRAELTEARWRQGRDRLQAAIAEAQPRKDMSGEVYNAAADLGRWLLVQEQFAGAQQAWEVAIKVANDAGGESDYARAEARMSHAATLIAQGMSATANSQSRPTDTRIFASADDMFAQADQELFEAQGIIGPYAFAATEGDGLSLGHKMYGSIVAWRGLVKTFVSSRGLRPLQQRAPQFRVEQEDDRPLCDMRLVAKPEPQFPPGAQTAFSTGSVVVRIKLDATGRVTDSRVAAAVPERWFKDSVDRVAGQWKVEREPSSAANCRYQPVMFVTYQFLFRR